MYDPEEEEFVEHVAGWNDQVEYDEDGEEEEENRRVVTIARLTFFLFNRFFWQMCTFASAKKWDHFDGCFVRIILF